MGNVATDTTTLAFTFTGTSTTRIWEIKVSQLTCSNANRFLAYLALESTNSLNYRSLFNPNAFSVEMY